MTTFYEQFMAFAPERRDQITQEAGLSVAYVRKHMYVSNHTPKFHFHNAMVLDSSSDGALPFIQHTAGDIDWRFIRRRLNDAHRRGEI